MVRRAFAAFERGDLDAAVADIDSDCEFVPTGTLPGGRGVYRGPEGYKRFSSWIKEEFEDAHVDVTDLTDAGDRVLISLTIRGRGRQSGATTTWDLWHVWTVQDGRFIHGQAFSRKTDALEAAGLSN